MSRMRWNAPWGWTRGEFDDFTFNECMWFTSQRTYSDGQAHAWCVFVLLITTAAMATLHDEAQRITSEGGTR